MTATTINTKNTPTAEAIQEALAFLRNLSEKSSMESADKPESFFNSDIFKTIEAALKSTAEAKTTAAPVKVDNSEGEDEKVHQKKHAACAATQDDEDEEDEDMDTDEDDDDDDDDNPFAEEYYWNPGPEWKTIGLVAGGAALVGLGALLYKLFDD